MASPGRRQKGANVGAQLNFLPFLQHRIPALGTVLATHGGWGFLLHLTLSQYSHPPPTQVFPDSCLQVPYRAHAYSRQRSC